MATNPDQPNTRRQHEAEAAAALALLTRKRYDLPALVAASRTRPRVMRRIGPTAALESNLAAPFLQIVRAWQAEQAELVTAYQGAATFNNASGLHAAIEAAGQRMDQISRFAARQIKPAIDTMERWHRAAWVARVKAATGIDVSAFVSSSEVAPEVAAAVAWNEALAADLNAQAKGRVASRVLGAAAAKAPAMRADAKTAGVDPAASVENLIADAVTKARTRARGIASDQAEKTSAGMTSGRAASAGLSQWMWQHNTEVHFRPEHKARNGMIFDAETAPADLPATLPFCRCVQIWLLQ